jgi:hypothetical protein
MQTRRGKQQRDCNSSILNESVHDDLRKKESVKQDREAGTRDFSPRTSWA